MTEETDYSNKMQDINVSMTHIALLKSSQAKSVSSDCTCKQY